MSNIYYSAERNGFYHNALREIYEASANGWPGDAVNVSAEDYENLLKGQSAGQIITANSGGQPILADQEIDWQDRAEQRRQGLLLAANVAIADWRTELQLDVISESDRASLIEWMEYIRDLKSLVFSGIVNETDFNSIVWPDQP